MTKIEIEKELRKVYKKMRSWPEINKKLNYIISKEEIERRELLLIGREELFRIETAKKTKSKLVENMHAATFGLIKATLVI